MEKSRVVLIVCLAALTVFNLILHIPLIVDGCICYGKGGYGACAGDCCMFNGETCTCYDVGTDNCQKAPKI